MTNEQKVPPSKLKLNLQLNNTNKKNTENVENREKSPTSSVKDVKDILLASSKNIIGKVLSPKDKSDGDNNKKVDKKPILMTRRELTDPFGSDDEDTPEVPANDNKCNQSKTPENGELPVLNGNKEGDELPKPNLVRIL